MEPSVEKIDIKPAYSVFKTRSYNVFKILDMNRMIDPDHVNKLKKEIQQTNLLSDFPILVNEGYEVLDGQHRLEAAKQLELEVFFIKSSNMKASSISRINSTQKPWQLMDYIEWHATVGNMEYRKAVDFINENVIDPAIAVSLLTGKETTGGDVSRKVKDGQFKVNDIEGANHYISMIKDFEQYYKHARQTRFIKAMIKVSRIEGYDHKIMLGKLSQQSRSLVKCKDVEAYGQLLCDIYNYKNQNKIYLR